jgi:hypothetical protein
LVDFGSIQEQLKLSQVIVQVGPLHCLAEQDLLFLLQTTTLTSFTGWKVAIPIIHTFSSMCID